MGFVTRIRKIYSEEGVKTLISLGIDAFFWKLRPFFYVFFGVFSSLSGRDETIWLFGDFTQDNKLSQNDKYLYLYLNNECQRDIRPVWITRSEKLYQELESNGYEVYRYKSLYSRYLALRAGFIFTSSNPSTTHWIYASGATKVQMTHGIPLKAPRTPECSTRLEKLLRDLYLVFDDYYNADYVLSSSASCSDRFRTHVDMSNKNSGFLESSFRTGKFLQTGYPRTDILYRDVCDAMRGVSKEEKRQINKIDPTKTVIGYFPTFREEKDVIRPFEGDQLLDFLREHDMQLVVKPHRYMDVDCSIGADETEGRIVQLPPSLDSHIILDRIDVLATDYSSIYFDYLLLDRPVIFYPYDYEKYSSERGLHDDYCSVIEGYIAKDFDEFLSNIEKCLREDEVRDGRQELRDSIYKYQDGNACERIISELLNRSSQTDTPANQCS